MIDPPKDNKYKKMNRSSSTAVNSACGQFVLYKKEHVRDKKIMCVINQSRQWNNKAKLSIEEDTNNNAAEESKTTTTQKKEEEDDTTITVTVTATLLQYIWEAETEINKEGDGDDSNN